MLQRIAASLPTRAAVANTATLPLRAFWYGLLWVTICGLFVVLTLGLGLILVWIPLGFVALWFIYRIARGWLALSHGRPMYV